ncbi:hypothetical protein BASA50_002817 [Batrachochytrium salamandrivorans]|uniref:Chorismate mutase n=1 Tax=Batrachochytrium salamandrivorans TaxID=1357716 RepID=A0ABQ8FLM9_9FUNG|nr:hypothetical protein BASA62_004261 [Batrachochytrium salamandrivorans]KAH6595881.1 hypothetical protein BASA61_003635 [Batrachochytrium salamandrivorans]KAH6599793.1 hypothetical protein BASA50_002817 [Batrachochytrium salamandrivorans]KAH9274029.1 chorismate mutase [Batrachochytrium salamandrivorans]
MNFTGEHIDLSRIRRELIRLEDSIIFALIERAQFASNDEIYQSKKFEFKDFDGSFLDYFLHEIEGAHAKVRRYTSPEEHPFTSPLPDPILPPTVFPKIIKENTVNYNDAIKSMYLEHIQPRICQKGSDGNLGSSATRDVEVLQLLSRRIHYGKFVAEAKYTNPKEHDEYVRLIQAKDREGIMALLTNKDVELKVLQRVSIKALTYGQEIDEMGKPALDSENPLLRITPDAVSDIYEKYIIPLTKEVEVDYLLERC